MVKVVADTGHVDAAPPGWPQQELMVRKALYDSGKVKTAADIKGLKVGTGIRGTSTDYAIYKMLQKAGLTFNDIDQTPMQPLELGVALTNGKIDAAVLIQPGATKMLNDGQAVHLMYDYDAVPKNQALNLLYSAQFAESDLAVPFMTAILKGNRMYNDAFLKKQTDARDKIFDAVVKYGPEKDRKVYESYTWFFAIDPDGKLDLPSMQDQQDYFVQGGFQTAKVDLPKIIDSRIAEQALAKLGPYK
jgi:NitT/TauT family transport system substrate-binding protein